ncbi:hypothetical protein BaRGS_00022944 [Batillaria attramentaria]|uniref:Uncharacterized protein n=1 Tax=Batillaria attramentaria TaxID=370345 RepID=A0ABD0KFL1_9CAEN
MQQPAMTLAQVLVGIAEGSDRATAQFTRTTVAVTGPPVQAAKKSEETPFHVTCTLSIWQLSDNRYFPKLSTFHSYANPPVKQVYLPAV